MILFKSAIREAVMSGRLTIQDDEGHPFPGWDFPEPAKLRFGWDDPKDPVGLQPASIDLHLGNHWLAPIPNSHAKTETTHGFHLHYYDAPILDTAKPIKYRETFADEYLLPAHGFVLVRTQEVVGLDASLFGKVDGRSSFGRAGLFAETAGVIDNGFKGSITLEVVNALPYPVRLYAGTRCCQITLYEGKGSAEGGYQGSYQGQLGTKGSMLYKTVPGGVR